MESKKEKLPCPGVYWPSTDYALWPPGSKLPKGMTPNDLATIYERWERREKDIYKAWNNKTNQS